MKICLITQIYNEEDRLLDWISYHKKIGIDRIIIFDDSNIKYMLLYVLPENT